MSTSKHSPAGDLGGYRRFAEGMEMAPKLETELFSLKPIFHCDAKIFALGPCIGRDPQCQNFALDIQTFWYLKTGKFMLPPTQTPKASQWNIGCVWDPTQNSRVGHVDCTLFSPFFRVGYPTRTLFSMEYGLKGVTTCYSSRHGNGYEIHELVTKSEIFVVGLDYENACEIC